MSDATSELFVQFVYSPDLSYDELHEREDDLMALLQTLFASHKAQAIMFDPMGDTLRAQCELESHTEEMCHAFCRELAPNMGDGVEARLLFVRKDIELISIYYLAEGEWKESCMMPPPAGAIGRALRDAKDNEASL